MSANQHPQLAPKKHRFYLNKKCPLLHKFPVLLPYRQVHKPSQLTSPSKNQQHTHIITHKPHTHTSIHTQEHRQPHTHLHTKHQPHQTHAYRHINTCTHHPNAHTQTQTHPHLLTTHPLYTPHTGTSTLAHNSPPIHTTHSHICTCTHTHLRPTTLAHTTRHPTPHRYIHTCTHTPTPHHTCSHLPHTEKHTPFTPNTHQTGFRSIHRNRNLLECFHVIHVSVMNVKRKHSLWPTISCVVIPASNNPSFSVFLPRLGQNNGQFTPRNCNLISQPFSKARLVPSRFCEQGNFASGS